MNNGDKKNAQKTPRLLSRGFYHGVREDVLGTNHYMLLKIWNPL